MLSRSLASILVFAALVALGHANAASGPAGPLKGLEQGLKGAGFAPGVQGWQDTAPVSCRHRPRHPTCTLIGSSKRLDVSLAFEGRTYHQSVWAIAFADDAGADRWLKAFATANDLPFGKALVGVHRCDRHVAVTVGVFRGPNPHKILNRAVVKHLGKRRCKVKRSR